MELDFVCVDFQYDFADKNGVNFNKGESVDFIKKTLVPFLLKNKIKVSEIVSDYRLPRGSSKNESCVPGTPGFESVLPSNLRYGTPWIKCMHNPLWIRHNIGVANEELGEPFQDPNAFNLWIKDHIRHKKVVLFGLTADCCVLQTASELYFRGYEVYCIYEATDPMNERLGCKDEILFNSTFALYSRVIHFDEMLRMIGGN